MVVLVGGENLPEKLQEICLLSLRQRPLGHVDSLPLHGLLEGILLRVVLEGEVCNVLLHQDIGIPGWDDVEVMLCDGDLESPELVVSGMDTEGRGDSDCIHSGFGSALADVLGELSDWSADVFPLLTRPEVVLGDIQGLQDLTCLLGHQRDERLAALLGRMIDGDDWNPIQDGVDCLVEFRIN